MPFMDLLNRFCAATSCFCMSVGMCGSMKWRVRRSCFFPLRRSHPATLFRVCLVSIWSFFCVCCVYAHTGCANKEEENKTSFRGSWVPFSLTPPPSSSPLFLVFFFCFLFCLFCFVFVVLLPLPDRFPTLVDVVIFRRLRS